MNIKTLSEIRQAQQASSDTVKRMYASMRLCNLYNSLYYDAEERLDSTATRIHVLFGDIPESYIKSEMTVEKLIARLREFDSESRQTATKVMLNNYLSVIFEIIFLPLYIGKNN